MLPAQPLLALLFAATALSAPAFAQDTPAHAATSAQPANSERRLDGYFPLRWQPQAGKLLLTIPQATLAPGQQFLLLDTLRRGVGANDLMLDRGQLGQGRLVEWYRSGNRLLLIEPNLAYRSSSASTDEQGAVRDSFAQTVLWDFRIENDGDGADGSVTVDATDFFLSDIHGVAERLQGSKQGAYHLDIQRSAIAAESLRDFPRNTEVESVLTFSDDATPAKLIQSVTPDAHHVTVAEHFSLIALPDAGYKARRFDPRSGYFSLDYRDYSVPLGVPMDQHLITRHRLEKKNPSAAVSDPVQPIVYYVDRGAPEPIRTALIEGASWWNEAFEAAGFHNAFQVRELPDGADPEDIRYNMIDWVHRSTRGWSYGESVVDPRTGEIIKGVVTLGSLRARQDFMIAEALLAPYANAQATPEQTRAEQAEALAMVLARIHQLAAHEVGHTLGLAHNFAASSIAQGTSVMDYPHPLITLDANGRPDLSHAYTTGIGAWDKAAIAYGYTEFPAGTKEPEALDALLRKDTTDGLIFVTDEDARPLGSLNARAHLWDNGTSPSAELTRMLAVRKAALEGFGENAIQPGQPLATLEDTLVPLYLLHRYQTEAAAKELGGEDYVYKLRGDNQPAARVVSAAEQQKALSAVLATLDPQALTLSPALLAILPPRPFGYDRTLESFPSQTDLAFDSQAAAATAANLTNALLFEPTRATRLVQNHDRDPAMPSLDAVIRATLAATWYAPASTNDLGETARTVQTSVLRHLLALAASEDAGDQARAVACMQVADLKVWLQAKTDPTLDADWRAHWAAALRLIAQWEKDPAAFAMPIALEAPPGQPIGSDDE
ncbi:zinc-dependent metalloprotease [Acidipila sp. EB88]|uniref:zinc-dependent metalloprotease n=1 Tax=Acidipila sp. EB88 TaxID=2305226 RepID=UPI000F5E294A|nr:zinc-dependent metalloprotease [Acidipila sp. EB88]